MQKNDKLKEEDLNKNTQGKKPVLEQNKSGLRRCGQTACSAVRVSKEKPCPTGIRREKRETNTQRHKP